MSNSTITEKVEELISCLNRLTESVAKLAAQVDRLEKLIDKKKKYKPHSEFKLESLHSCYEQGEFPHLFHTDNPQLNNIADMLVHIHNCCCNRSSKDDSLQELKDLIDLLKDKQKGKLIIDPLDKLYRLISQLEISKPSPCLMVEDLEKFLEKGKKSDTREIVILDKDIRIKPPFSL